MKLIHIVQKRKKMKTYRMNAVMTGLLYFMGTVFGILCYVVGGEVLSSISTGNILGLVAANSSRLSGVAFFNLMMGISLVAMTVFLYPILRKDSKELAMGMVLFRGALEGVWYFMSTLGFLTLVALGNESIAPGANSAALQSMRNVLSQFQDHLAVVGPIFFLIGATFLYLSFYRTRLIPRWLTVWGLIGVVCSLASVLLSFFHVDTSFGGYLEYVIAPQEMVMAVWLIVKGFNPSAIAALFAKKGLNEV
jgi:hypothetical protein